jgi:two-component system, OmpR family, sensor histidine kinase CpxA
LIRPPLPLYGQVLLWLGLNLLLLTVVALVLLGGGLSWDALSRGPLGDRPQALAGAIASEMVGTGPDSWPAILARQAYDEDVDLTLCRPDGTVIAGTHANLPADLRTRMSRARPPTPRPGPPPGPPPGSPPGPLSAPPSPSHRPPTPADRVFADHADDRYWFVVQVPMPGGGPEGAGPLSARPAFVVAHTASFWRFAVFTGTARWVPVACGLALVSGLLWWPLVRSLTRTVKQVTTATESIAQGRLDTRVDVGGRDELTRLALAVNRMAERLERFVTDERRFMGDVAHELASPIARAQVALSLLERKIEPAGLESLRDVREEVEYMGLLVGELLSFSRAAIAPRSITPEPVELSDLVRATVSRERADDAVQIDVPPGLTAIADRELLARALANLVRNAVRYAAHAGPVEVHARHSDNLITLRVLDRGPGVPPESLARLGDPFFRPDSARSRETGGAGLGLAIVRTAAQACGGTLLFANREGGGFVATLTLKPA